MEVDRRSMPLAPQGFSMEQNYMNNLGSAFRNDLGEEDEAAGDMLRILTGCDSQKTKVEEKQGAGGSVSWSELELNCQKLDDAHIRIESLDLSNVDEGVESENAHNIGFNVEVEADQDSPYACSLGQPSAAAAFLAHNRHNQGFSDLGRPSSGPLQPTRGSPSPSSDSNFHLGSHMMNGVSSGSPSHLKPIPFQGGSLTNSPSLSASSGPVRYQGSPALSFDSFPQDPHSRSSRLHYANGMSSFGGPGDIIGSISTHHIGDVGLSVSGLPLAPSSSAKGAGAGAPGRTVSGAWKPQSIAAGSNEGCIAMAGGVGQLPRGASCPGNQTHSTTRNAISLSNDNTLTPANPAKADPLALAVLEAKKAQSRDAMLAKEGEKFIEQEGAERVPVRYSSLVLPGAIPRDQARRGGVRGYFQNVKSKCGELFTSSRKTKS